MPASEPSHDSVPFPRADVRAPWWLGLAAMLSTLACYKPAVVDGGFRCGVSNACPEGTTCIADHCYVKGSPKIPTDAKADLNDGGPSEMCEPKTAPSGTCTVKDDLACDPVCQTGCCSNQKCTAMNVSVEGTTAAKLGCSPATPSRGLGETCDPSNAGTAERLDNCQAGLACVDGDGTAICLKLCRDDGDCSDGTRCEQRKLDGQGTALTSVCGVPSTPCMPTAPPASSMCPSQRTCYLVDTNPTSGDRTVCDISAGQGKQTSCRYARDCYPGFTCATAGIGIGRCWPVCDLDSPICPGITQCQNVGQTYGYCD
jgi:hypothetical protein